MKHSASYLRLTATGGDSLWIGPVAVNIRFVIPIKKKAPKLNRKRWNRTKRGPKP